MNSLTEYQKPTAKTIDQLQSGHGEPLEVLLQNLCYVGVPSLFRMRDGWWVSVKMHVAAKGTEFKVESESTCATPSDAARQCTERILATLKQYQP